MNSRERFWKWANYESNDIPAWGDWLGPYSFWIEQGMPPAPDKYLQMEDGISRYFLDMFQQEGKYSAFWGTSRVPVHLDMFPGYKTEVLDQDETHEIIRTTDGVICKRLKAPDSTLIATQYLSHPLTGPDSWEQFKNEQLDPKNPGRYPGDAKWKDIKAKWPPGRDHIITIDGGSFYGFIRNWMGVENASYAFYDEPEWMHEVMDYLADFFIEVLSRAVRELDIDIAMFWEDMCFKTGPLISPAMFREFMLEPYQRVTSFLSDNGVKLSFVDCDGNIEQLVSLWLEGGVRGFYPLEVASDMRAETLLHKYREDKILLWGNVDKRELAKGYTAIDAELERLAPAVAMGGFIPLVDHGVPEDIPFDHYCYYAKRRAELFNIKICP